MLQELPEQLQPHMLINTCVSFGYMPSDDWHSVVHMQDMAAKTMLSVFISHMSMTACCMLLATFIAGASCVTRTLLTQLPLPPQTTHLEELRGAEVRASRMAGREDEWSPNARGRCAKVQEDGSTDDRPGRWMVAYARAGPRFKKMAKGRPVVAPRF